jgi:hypothetical protein
MKSNVIMQSPDRELFGVIVKQQTKDSFVSVSDLQTAYNKARWQYGWSDKRINDILSTDATKERIYHLLNERGLIKTTISAFMDMVEIEGIVKCLKGLGVWKTTGRGNNKAVFCDPYIWVLLAMELNPLLYAKVVIWITDTLIFDRIEAGSAYKPMNEAIAKIISKPEYYKYAKEINEKVFGKHFTGMRQLASKHELQKITRIETLITDNIQLGFIKSEQDILNVLSKINIGA